MLAINNHIKTIINPASLFWGLMFLNFSFAWIRHSSITRKGISLIAREIPKGNNIMSSKYPNIGMKSGIKSIGLSAYPTTRIETNFAYQGTSDLL